VNVQAKDYNQSLFEAADRRAQANLDSGKWDQNRFNQYMEKTRVGRSGSLAGQEEARNVHGFINAEIAGKGTERFGRLAESTEKRRRFSGYDSASSCHEHL
jgi:hypothetical protein